MRLADASQYSLVFVLDSYGLQFLTFLSVLFYKRLRGAMRDLVVLLASNTIGMLLLGSRNHRAEVLESGKKNHDECQMRTTKEGKVRLRSMAAESRRHERENLDGHTLIDKTDKIGCRT